MFDLRCLVVTQLTEKAVCDSVCCMSCLERNERHCRCLRPVASVKSPTRSILGRSPFDSFPKTQSQRAEKGRALRDCLKISKC